MQLKHSTKQKGFTLIELLVSIALFSIVMTIALGAIVTISDSNKKARSLMSVMNNLNFAVDSMTRSFKSGEITTSNSGLPGDCFETTEVTYSGVGDQSRRVQYCWDQDNNWLTKAIGGGSAVPLTSDDVTIEYASFQVFGTPLNEQPLLVIILEGEVRITEKITSKFSIHTSVAQRKLNI